MFLGNKVNINAYATHSVNLIVYGTPVAQSLLGVRMNKVIKISEVKELTTLSNASIYRLIKLGEFPKQLKLAERSSGWLLEEINNWLESKRINRDEVQS